MAILLLRRVAMTENSDRANLDPAPVDRLSQIWRRINQHKLVQWSVAYVALAYGIQHAIILTSESFEWPNAVPRLSMLLFLLGLPLVMTFAWYHGARASRRFSPGECTIISLLLLCASLLFYVFVKPESATTPARIGQEASVTAARTAAASSKGAISVAVLPFLNLSADKDQEFFSDGMTEEITAALAKVPDLRVVARTSAFEFKGKNVDIRTMGEQLGATHLIEGSVRKAGNRLRITAQLIKADDGTHVWAEDYDRELTDVFAIQEDIARAITSSLHMTLGLKPGENIINNRAIDTAGYEQFLRARSLVSSHQRDPSVRAASQLEQLVARYPNYAPAWGWLAGAYYFIVNNGPELTGPIAAARDTAQYYLQKMESASRRAIELDPTFAGGYSTLSLELFERGKMLAADDMVLKALSMDPTNPDILNGRMIGLAIEGRLKEAVATARELHSLEPYVPAHTRNAAVIFWAGGENDTAISLMNSLPKDSTNDDGRAMLLASAGRYMEAADLLENISVVDVTPQLRKQAARFLQLAPNAPDAQTAPALNALDWVYLHTNAPDRALGIYERDVTRGFFSYLRWARIWHPSYAPVRKTERFKTLVRALGLPEFWRAKGWPPQCHPTTGDDFECS